MNVPVVDADSARAQGARNRRKGRCLNTRDSFCIGRKNRFSPRRGRPARRTQTAPRVRRARWERAARMDAPRFPWPTTPNELPFISHAEAI